MGSNIVPLPPLKGQVRGPKWCSLDSGERYVAVGNSAVRGRPLSLKNACSPPQSANVPRRRGTCLKVWDSTGLTSQGWLPISSQLGQEIGDPHDPKRGSVTRKGCCHDRTSSCRKWDREPVTLEGKAPDPPKVSPSMPSSRTGRRQSRRFASVAQLAPMWQFVLAPPTTLELCDRFHPRLDGLARLAVPPDLQAPNPRSTCRSKRGRYHRNPLSRSRRRPVPSRR